MSDAFFAEAERAIEAITAAGETPARWMLTDALYRHLQLEADGWRVHADRAALRREEPVPLYNIPVTVEAGAFQSWTLATASGRTWCRTGEVVYSAGAAPKVAHATKEPSHGATPKQG